MAKIINKPVATKPITKPVEVVAPVSKKAKFLIKNALISPRKLRLLANDVKSLNPLVALTQLKFTNTKAARILFRGVQNVIADAKNNFGINTDTLKFDNIKVDEGIKIKRMDKSHGSRFNRGIIQKRRSRLEIIVKGETK